MKPFEFVKAFFFAIIIMVINVAISFGVVAVYSHLIDPGHDLEYYQAAAQEIAPWSSVVAGFFLFLAAAYVAAKRKPDRPAVGFAIAIWVAYLLIEVAIMSAEGALVRMAGIMTLSLATKLIGAFAGAKMARK